MRPKTKSPAVAKGQKISQKLISCRLVAGQSALQRNLRDSGLSLNIEYRHSDLSLWINYNLQAATITTSFPLDNIQKL